MAYRQTKPRWLWGKPAAPARHSDHSGPRVHFLAWPGQVHPPKGVQGGPPASLGRPPTFRPWESRRQPGVAGYFWVWRGRGTVRGTGNWGAGVGKPKEFFQLPSPMLHGTPAPWPLNYGAATENWPTHRSRALHPPGSGREQGSEAARVRTVSELEDPEKKLHPT